MFEHSLIDMEKRPRSGRRWISFPVAVVLHAVAFGAVTFLSYWSVGAVAEADLMEPYAIQLQLPETRQEEPIRRQAAPEPAPSPQDQTAPRPPIGAQPKIVQPGPAIPDLIPIAADLPTLPGDGPAPGPVDPEPCPECKGTDPGAKGGPGAGEGDGPVVLQAGMKPPVVVSRVDPRYTEAARKVGLQGIVVVEAVIDERGRVAQVKVLRGLPLGLEEAAVAAVRQWRFEPATTLDGRPVKVYYNLTVNFRVLR